MTTLWWLIVLWLACTVAGVGGFALHAELALRREVLETVDRIAWGHERTDPAAIDFGRKRVGE